jgi:hypothetical protein
VTSLIRDGSGDGITAATDDGTRWRWQWRVSGAVQGISATTFKSKKTALAAGRKWLANKEPGPDG